MLIISVAAVMWVGLPLRCPAPLIFTPGEGWRYEAVGEDSGRWRADNAEDQLLLAKELYEKEEYKSALKAARRVVSVWPLSDFAPEAQFLVGMCYVHRDYDEKAFREFQTALTKYPKVPQYEEIIEQQYRIANSFLEGRWFRLWGVIPLYPSMERTIKMYEDLIKNGPYSSVAPDAQMKIGQAYEKRKKYGDAVKAYEKAADRYNDRPEIAGEALFKAGMAYFKQSKKADYDQSVAGKAIATFTDFSILYPGDERVVETQGLIEDLKTEQARGSFEIAAYYAKKKKWDAALIYYNEVLIKAPESSYADEAKVRINNIRTDQASVEGNG